MTDMTMQEREDITAAAQVLDCFNWKQKLFPCARNFAILIENSRIFFARQSVGSWTGFSSDLRCVHRWLFKRQHLVFLKPNKWEFKVASYKLIKIRNKLLSLLAEAFRNFFHYHCQFFIQRSCYINFIIILKLLCKNLIGEL